MTNSKKKGAAGELEWAHFLMDNFGIKARRSQQYKGTADSADVESDWDFIHWEVKRVEKLNVEQALAKAEGDCGRHIPVVAHRSNGKKWMITMRAEYLEYIAWLISQHKQDWDPYVPGVSEALE